MTPADLEPHWSRFKTFHHSVTVAHIETILGEEITEDAFVQAHIRTCKARNTLNGGTSHARNLYKFLVKWNWIINPDLKASK